MVATPSWDVGWRSGGEAEEEKGGGLECCGEGSRKGNWTCDRRLGYVIVVVLKGHFYFFFVVQKQKFFFINLNATF